VAVTRLRRSRIVPTVTVLAIAVAACSGGGAAGPSGTAAATQAGSGQPQTFTSAVYGYSVTYPTGWRAVAAERQLNTAEFPDSGTASDRLTRHPDTDPVPLIEVAAQPVAAGTTLKDWTASVVAITYPHLVCHPDGQETITVGGEPATLLRYANCAGSYVAWTAVVHRNLGFHVTLITDPGLGTADEAEYRLVLDTIVFAD
jgi:hypothetical protein